MDWKGFRGSLNALYNSCVTSLCAPASDSTANTFVLTPLGAEKMKEIAPKLVGKASEDLSAQMVDAIKLQIAVAELIENHGSIYVWNADEQAFQEVDLSKMFAVDSRPDLSTDQLPEDHSATVIKFSDYFYENS